MRWLVTGFLLVTACTGFTQASPVNHHPTKPPPGGFDSSVTFEGGVVTDTRTEVGSCATTYVWSSTDHGNDWLVVAVNEILVDPEGRSSDGHEVFCHPVLQSGPREFPIPYRSLKPGWYASCTKGCSQPFEVRRTR